MTDDNRFSPLVLCTSHARDISPSDAAERTRGDVPATRERGSVGGGGGFNGTRRALR